jgi:hypothetical protein
MSSNLAQKVLSITYLCYKAVLCLSICLVNMLTASPLHNQAYTQRRDRDRPSVCRRVPPPKLLNAIQFNFMLQVCTRLSVRPVQSLLFETLKSTLPTLSQMDGTNNWHVSLVSLNMK